MALREPAASLKTCILQLLQIKPYPNKNITDDIDKCIRKRIRNIMKSK
jgi:hypothetical protein